ncbi:MaoC family dehydratase N-terminal domain-containing protein [Phytohabitans sp. ZYX-F-186]|uniref:MaoC family dehydratase N-terminal domain-containing protein n=1 Tax=Phytohabitans maris TaxID=3071409 RepID=A0ABU0ZK59_9ACTN|nr:MaoC family dehydratase N-terminal domain-containing protein [Phytohabitans sp. ZYX-F-186]MDQ7907438.1 MaoC family dehydratase N-terminal domain-containing protein [Phytohabitans sp. ZYX-F-186]
MARLFGVDVPDLETDGLPLLWHWVYLLERPHQVDLGADGHPVRGVVPAPPAPGRRRMAAGGRVMRHGPLVVGRAATRRTEVVSLTEKEGRTGPLTFVVVRHTIVQGGAVKVVEEQDIVYRAAVAAGSRAEADAVTPVPLEPGEWSLPVDPTLLFRFSALTYNAHRIHYDRDYARDIEGYPGLVTHGPLQALAMAECVRRTGVVATAIDYRLVAPLFDHQGLVTRSTQAGSSREVSVRDLSGRITANGNVQAG